MPRLTGTIDDSQTGFNLGNEHPIVSLDHGGAFGHAVNWKALASDTPHLKQRLHVRVMECPEGFDDLDDPEKWRKALVSIFERHAEQWSGIQSTIQVQTQEMKYGHGGEVVEAVSKLTRARTTPNATYTDKYGRPISHFHIGWGLNLLGDPDTNIPNVVTREGYQPREFLLDYYSATVLWFIPDITMRYIDFAWLSGGVFPKSMPPEEGSRDGSAPTELINFSIEYAAVTQTGAGVKRLAQRILNQMRLTGTSPYYRNAFLDEVDANVMATEQTYQHQLDNIRKDTTTELVGTAQNP